MEVEHSPFPPWNILWFSETEFRECATSMISKEIEERIAEEWIERVRRQECIDAIEVAAVDTAIAACRLTVRINFDFAGTVSTDRATNAVNI